MCGIFGILGNYPVISQIIKGLTKLEYRGYDSSGVAILENKKIKTIRAKGKLINLKKKINLEKIKGQIGIGHTRWATHGIPSTNNAHPHTTDEVSIVHNGIIENYSELKKRLISQGCIFQSETDSEVISHLLNKELKSNPPEIAVKRTLGLLEGAFALAIIFKKFNLLVGSKKGSPLAIGISDDSTFLGSDSVALSPFTDKVCFLEEGDTVFIKNKSYQIFDEDFKKVKRVMKKSSHSGESFSKGNFSHYMQKEIYEQPHVIGDSLSRFLDPINKKINFPNLKINWKKISKINLIACGTSYYACQIASYWFEKFSGIRSIPYFASEFRYRDYIKEDGILSIFISQSGETADTLAALKFAKKNKSKILSIVNVNESSISRESDFSLSIAAGPEIGVASTKAFSAQLSILSCLCLVISREKKMISKEIEKKLTEALLEVPSKMSLALELSDKIKKISEEIVDSKSALFLGRGNCFPIAMEGALKLKEISYIHAEGYASGEMKHGPIALVDDKVPVVIIAPMNSLFEKNFSNMQEILARGGRVILVTDEKGNSKINSKKIKKIILPELNEYIQPIIYCIPVQLLAYFVAVKKGTDVDQPRNLAKSVTVE
ncbi:MAG: Glutamine--fructose-6-phosphate aminotransferase [isomerizing] [Alphaproteobacteria bacterium MarineAlpha8_Bin1]|nr:MAG: Glutamine--fructose-6-phosphate aminotransferase [isomerizing] [Alphaproteobacteria bacterium MarineAlpha8_Bin1]